MRKFFKTVAIVTVFSVCEKFLGFLYRIYLSRSIGAEGVGLYQVALSVFALLLTLCSSGTPITVSRLMTKYKAENDKIKERKVISAGLFFTLALAVPLTLFFSFSNGFLHVIFADERCIPIFKTILPGLIFTSVYAVLRGVFWGNKDFLPYSIIELLEEVVMIFSGILLISRTNDVFAGAFGAGISVLISYLSSFLLAVSVFFFRKNKLVSPKSQLKPLISSALPITAMRTANSFATSLISIVLPLRLIAFGYSEAQTMSMFGAALGQAIPILFIPTTLIGSFTLVLVQEIAENYYRKNFNYLRRDIEKAVKLSCLVGCIFLPVLFTCGTEIGILIFNNHESGKYITASSFLVVFMSVSNITTSILNSVGKETKTLIYFIISQVFMLLAIWFLPKYFGIYSLLIGFTFVYGLTTILNIVLLNKICKPKPVYVKSISLMTILTIPSILFGNLIKGLLLPILGNFFTLIICSILIVGFLLLTYLATGLIKIRYVKEKFNSLRGKKVKKANN